MVYLEKRVPPFSETQAELPHLRKIICEPVAAYGTLASLLLQIAHPGVGRGVHEHSEFASRQIDRAEKTEIYVHCMVYGTPEEKAFVKEWVDMVHSRVKGGEGKDQYSALDPGLQLWVAATMYETMVTMYEKVYGTFSPEDAERVYHEFTVFATSLQVPPEDWPKDRAAFKEYYQQVLNNDLDVLPSTKQVFHHIMHPQVPLALRPLVPPLLFLLRAFAIPLLPPEILDAFGLPRKQRRIEKMVTALMLSSYRLTPGFIRHIPKRYYMRRTRKMVKILKDRGFTADMKMRAS